MKTIIAGSRDIELYEAVRYAISIANHDWDITEVVSGGARGPDKLGEKYAKENDIPIRQFTPDYTTYGPKVAPYKRNAQMGFYGDAAIIIWDGQSNGTKHMMKCMTEEGKPYSLVKIALDYERHQDTIVRTYTFDDGTKFIEYPDGKFIRNDNK